MRRIGDKAGELFVALIILAISAGCTHNDGDIGEWFGMWSVERIDIDSEPQADYKGNVILKFQGCVMESCTLLPYHETESYFANCRYEPDALILGCGNDGAWIDGFAPALMLPKADDLRLEIVAFGKGEAILRWHDTHSGITNEYFLKKIYD